MSHFKVVARRYEQGLSAYRAGHSLRDIINLTNEIEKTYDDLPADATPEQCDEVFHGAQSATLGFAEGFLEDFRSILHSPTISRRGPSA